MKKILLFICCCFFLVIQQGQAQQPLGNGAVDVFTCPGGDAEDCAVPGSCVTTTFLADGFCDDGTVFADDLTCYSGDNGDCFNDCPTFVLPFAEYIEFDDPAGVGCGILGDGALLVVGNDETCTGGVDNGYAGFVWQPAGTGVAAALASWEGAGGGIGDGVALPATSGDCDYALYESYTFYVLCPVDVANGCTGDGVNAVGNTYIVSTQYPDYANVPPDPAQFTLAITPGDCSGPPTIASTGTCPLAFVETINTAWSSDDSGCPGSATASWDYEWDVYLDIQFGQFGATGTATDCNLILAGAADGAADAGVAVDCTSELCAPAAGCTSAPDPGPAFACSGSDFQVPLDVTTACVTDPNFDVYPTDGTAGVSGYIAFYFVDAAGNFTNCPAGSTADDVLANLNPPAGTAGFAFFGESNAANGGGCSPVEIGAFTNPTCAPIDIPICLLNGDVNTFVVSFDTDGDGVSDVACDVFETTVTIYPNVETVVAADGGCDNAAAAFVTDGAGGIIGDLDGDGAITVLDACDFATLGGNPLDPAFDPADTADDCADGSTLDYDFTPALAYLTDANYPGCVEPATGTLTCACAVPPSGCTSAPDPGPAFACGGSDFQVPLDVATACVTDPNFDVYPTDGTAGVSGYIAFYFVDAAGNFTNCPAGSTADDVLANLNPPAGTAGFAFFGESNAANGGGCSPVEIGAFTNPTCAPIDIPICLLNGDVNTFVVSFDTDGDGVSDVACDVFETTVTIYPNVETVVAADGGCDNAAAAFVTDGAGGIIGDLDGDGAITVLDACDFAALGGNPLDPAFDPADTADDCADGSTLDYDFTPALAYLTDANYPGCVEPATGTLTCACAVPPSACTSAPDAGPAYACSGSDFQVPLDVAAGCTTEPTFDDQAIFPGGVSGYIAFYFVDAAGNFTNCPAGSTAEDVLANLNPPAGTAGFAFFGESNAANGGGCSPVEIGAFTNPTCAPIDIPICLLNGDVTGFFVTYDADDDGVNEINCSVSETTVTIYPNVETVVAADGGCDNAAAAFVTDGTGGIIGDLDGDGAITVLDACDFAALGGNPLDPAFDPADTADDCADGSTLDYDFTPALAYLTDANYPGCVEPLTGTLACTCAAPTCAIVIDLAATATTCDGGELAYVPGPTCSGDFTGFFVEVYQYVGALPAGPDAAFLAALPGTDPFNNADLNLISGLTTCADLDTGAGLIVNNTSCDPVTIYTIVTVTDDVTFEIPADCAPTDFATVVNPALTAQLVSEDPANCGDLVAALFDADGNECPGTQMTATCAAAGDGVAPVASFPVDPNGCYPAQDVTGTICAGCVVVCEDEIMGQVTSDDPACALAGVDVIIRDGMGNIVTTLTTDASGNYDSTPAVFPCGSYTAELDPATVPTCYTDLNGPLGPRAFVIDDDPTNTDTDGASFNAAIAPDIPTLSEWGLITLALLLMTLGAVKMAVGSVALAGTGSKNIPMPGGNSFRLPFDMAIFRKALNVTAILAIIGFAICFAIFGAIFMPDMIGVAIAGPIFAYLAHLLYILETKNK